MKSGKHLLVLSFFVASVLCWAQEDAVAGKNSQVSNNSNPVQLVAKSTKALDYRQGSKSVIALRGTDVMPDATGKADVDTKSATTQIKAELEDLKPANNLGLEYVTYVLWAISPEGVPSNLGELL